MSETKIESYVEYLDFAYEVVKASTMNTKLIRNGYSYTISTHPEIKKYHEDVNESIRLSRCGGGEVNVYGVKRRRLLLCLEILPRDLPVVKFILKVLARPRWI